MQKIHNTTLKGLAFSASAIALTVGSQASAQDGDCPPGQQEVGEECIVQDDTPDGVTSNSTVGEVVDVSSTGADGSTEAGAIVVTGSRIQREDTYNSISPLQILETEALNDAGQFDAVQILQTSESAAGIQIDSTFQGFVLNNGPGSSTIDLRGLGADRTLVLINGRRMAPGGVEGAPSSPSINLVPSSLVARYDLLNDGASSVYGSDAVAGVVNLVLRNDFDGLEINANVDLNEQGAGHDFDVSTAWGKNGSNFNFGIGASYARRDEVTFDDRDFLRGCNTHYEITDTGEIRTLGIADNANTLADSGGTIGEIPTECTIDRAARRIIPTGLYFGSIYYADGTPGNTGFGFNDAFDAFGRPVDRNGDGLLDVNYADVTRNGTERGVTYIPGEDRYSAMAYGDYTFDGDMNLTPFFEALYSRLDSKVDNSGTPQLFPFVPASNPFNVCNIANNDCGDLQNQFDGLYTFAGGRFAVPTGRSYQTRPVVNVRGDRNNYEIRLEQYRGVLGLRGDLPFIDFGSGNDWTFELSGVYSRSEGYSNRRGIRNDRLAYALGFDPTQPNPTGNPGAIVLPDGACGDPANFVDPDAAQPDLTQGCVPVNLYADSLYRTAVGDFATQAERDYLFDDRTFDTIYEQKLASVFAQGSLFELAGGTAKGVIGAEFRNDSLESLPGTVAAEGLFFGFFSDKGAVGDKNTMEAFGELDLPLMADRPMVRDLRVNLSGRVTDDEFYGTNETYSLKLGWRPIDPLLIKFAYGTSFRAPNLRENFLAGQSGFGSVIDPCAVPSAAYAPLGGGYLAENDTREDYVLANCRREGRDPTVVGTSPTNVVQSQSVEITSGGSFDLDPETSTSLTTGFSFEEGIGPLDFAFNFNYYDIQLKGAIAEPTAAFVVNSCFLREDATRSPLCDSIQYDTDPASRQLISDVFAGFININRESVRGLDLNANFAADVEGLGKDVRLGLNLRANHLIERNSVLVDALGNESVDIQQGDFGFPSWTGRGTFTADVDNVRFTWSTRFIGRTEQQDEFIDPFSDAFGNGPDGEPTGFVGNTCTGGGSDNGVVEGDGVYCRDVGFADFYTVSNASVRFDFDWFDFRLGVTNIFDVAPPLVDCNELGACRSNTPLGNGYNLDGREFFISTRYRF